MVSSTKGDIAEGGNLYFNLAGHRQLDALGYVTGFMIDNSNYHSSENSTQSFGPQDILDGKMDAQIKQIATAIKQFRKPITWQYPKEPAGTIFSLFGANGKEDANWIGVVNDTCTLGSAMNCLSNPWNFNQYVSKYGTSCNTNGDMMCLDGAERYRDLARYYYEFMEKEGA